MYTDSLTSHVHAIERYGLKVNKILRSCVAARRQKCFHSVRPDEKVWTTQITITWKLMRVHSFLMRQQGIRIPASAVGLRGMLANGPGRWEELLGYIFRKPRQSQPHIRAQSEIILRRNSPSRSQTSISKMENSGITCEMSLIGFWWNDWTGAIGRCEIIFEQNRELTSDINWFSFPSSRGACGHSLWMGIHCFHF